MESTIQSVNTNSHAEVPEMNNYLTPLTNEHIKSLSQKIEAVLKTFKNKIEENSSVILGNQEEIQTKEFASIKIAQTPSQEKYNFILETLSFIHRENTCDSSNPQIKQINSDLLQNYLNKLNDKGVLVCLMDYHYLLSLPKVISQIKDVNLLVKLYIVEKLPLVGLLYLQKFEKSSFNAETLKLLSYEIYEDFTITKPISYLVNDTPKALTYMYEMYQYQGYLDELRPGLVLKVNVKENFWSDNIDFTLTIVDTEDEDLKAKKSCVAIIVTKAYANDFIYLTKEGNMALCQQVKASRLILIRPNAFNYDSVNLIKDKISHYIVLFKFRDCVNESIPIMLFSDSGSETYDLYRTNSYLIRDLVENEKKETFRQLIFHAAPNEVQSEIKLLLTLKSKAKHDKDNYTVLPTIQRYSEKNFVSCLDKTFICSFYIKCLLTGAFFLNSEDFPKRNFEFLVMGAGIGSVNHYFDLLFKGKVNFTSVEIDKTMPEIGQNYFGFKNFERENYNWVYGDAKEYLISNSSKKFDMIISDINNTNPNDGISPPPVFFEQEVLDSIKNSLSDSGIYVINLMSRSYNNYNSALAKLETTFENIFIVENNEDLNKIHFCFNKKLSNEEHVKLYKNNLDNFNQNADMSIIINDFKRILSKIVDMNDIKAKPTTKA